MHGVERRLQPRGQPPGHALRAAVLVGMDGPRDRAQKGARLVWVAWILAETVAEVLGCAILPVEIADRPARILHLLAFRCLFRCTALCSLALTLGLQRLESE